MINFTELKDRKLWIDGDSTITNMEYLYTELLNHKDISSLFIDKLTDEIKTYNKFTNTPLKIKTDINHYSLDWNIPEFYKNLEVKRHILKKLESEVSNNNFSDAEVNTRINRVILEVNLWKENNLLDLLKTLIYIVDIFQDNDIVWGTGRGSSCCCYILYLIGLHDVDSVYYNLDIKEFFRK